MGPHGGGPREGACTTYRPALATVDRSVLGEGMGLPLAGLSPLLSLLISPNVWGSGLPAPSGWEGGEIKKRKLCFCTLLLNDLPQNPLCGPARGLCTHAQLNPSPISKGVIPYYNSPLLTLWTLVILQGQMDKGLILP